MPTKLSTIPATNQLKRRKRLSIPVLLALDRKEFEAIKEHRIKTISYKLTDVLMSALAKFGLKYPSLLQFDQSNRDEGTRANLSNLYGVEQAPSDSPMREILDPVASEDLRPAFRQVHRELQRQKALTKYQLLAWLAPANFRLLKSTVTNAVVEYSERERNNTLINCWLPSSYTQT